MEEKEIDLIELFNIKGLFEVLLRKKFIIIATTLVFAILALFKYGTTNSPQQENISEENKKLSYAQTTFIFGTTNTMKASIEQNSTNALPIDIAETSKVVVNNNLVDTYSEIIKSQSALTKVIKELNLDSSYDSLYRQISVSRIGNGNLIRIAVANPDEKIAIQIADALMNEFLNNISNIYFSDQISVVDSAYTLSKQDLANIFISQIFIIKKDDPANMKNILAEAKISEIISDEDIVDIFQNYIVNSEAIKNILTSPNALLSYIPESHTPVVQSPNTNNVIKKIVIFAVLGFVASSFIIVLIELFNDSVKNEKSLNSPVLATLQKDKNNNFNILRTKLLDNKLFLITGIQDTEKNSYVANNLAISFASTNKKILFINISSKESALVDSKSKNNLSEFLNSNQSNITNFIKTSSNYNNLDILSSNNTSNIYIDDNKLINIITSVENNYDFIIINSDDILNNANTLLISKIVKNTLLVIEERKTKITDYRQAKHSINDVNGNLLGNVIIK